jgi:hypothetical protein
VHCFGLTEGTQDDLEVVSLSCTYVQIYQPHNYFFLMPNIKILGLKKIFWRIAENQF